MVVLQAPTNSVHIGPIVCFTGWSFWYKGAMLVYEIKIIVLATQKTPNIALLTIAKNIVISCKVPTVHRER
jgi:hypothetical protein